MPDIVIDQFPDFLGHLTVQDAGQPFVDLLPIERGTGWEVVLKNSGESSDYLILLFCTGLFQPEAVSRPVAQRRGALRDAVMIQKHLILEHFNGPWGLVTRSHTSPGLVDYHNRASRLRHLSVRDFFSESSEH
ncbi:MAG TPA: hypothetical protein VGQ12_15375 [Candidatus Angelobacter sp.]|nr:hypothetical protein [Candidatus Angelobacter sp.]